VLDKGRHELACASCGAPLHDLKRLPQSHPGQSSVVQPSALRRGPVAAQAKPQKPQMKKLVKKRKSLFRHLVEEAFEAIEDVFD